MKISYKSSESVTEGHPDKIADQISDAILDNLLEQDKNSRVACETITTTGLVLVAGEIATEGYVDLQTIARKVIKDIGYTETGMGFHYDDVAVMNVIHEQSPDIAQGVVATSPEDQGAGDQGLMFGYATNQTENYMPLPIALAHKLTMGLAKLRKTKKLSYLRPDGKSQVGIRYEDRIPKEAVKVTLAAQHREEITLDQIREDLTEELIKPVVGEYFNNDTTNVIVNGTGKFVIGGPHGDSGLTGRKIIVDTYGGIGSHGGGAFSGKDPSKVDRSGAYAARYIAKNIVASGLAKEVGIQISYTIGVAEPFTFNIDTFGTGSIDDGEIRKKVLREFDLRPGKIIEYFDLKRPIYLPTAAYGHFGRSDIDLPWEKVDLF
jgi:S-adenosylmethionine synthetase